MNMYNQFFFKIELNQTSIFIHTNLVQPIHFEKALAFALKLDGEVGGFDLGDLGDFSGWILSRRKVMEMFFF